MQAFFSPRSKCIVSRPVARILNTANLLGPVLLFLALILLGTSAWGDWTAEEKSFLVTTAAILIAMALIIRVIWGVAVAVIRRRKQTEDGRRKTHASPLAPQGTAEDGNNSASGVGRPRRGGNEQDQT